jgi:DNA-3-methyladenine glycosylase
MYHCLNIVAEPAGVAGCVLIRAVEPMTVDRDIVQAYNGPGKLTRALGITLEHYGVDVTRGPITIHTSPRQETLAIGVSPRVGISRAADLPLRFFVKGNQFVSREPRR